MATKKRTTPAKPRKRVQSPAELAAEAHQKAVENGVTAIRADYHRSIRSIAECIKGAIAREEITSADDLQTTIHESADGNYYTIYTHANLRALMASDNWLAAEDVSDVADIISGASSLSDIMARYVYHAIEADIVQALESLDVDVNDPCPCKGKIRTSFETFTPESMEQGDADERGWVDEEGTEHTVDEAVSLLLSTEASSGEFHAGIWYTDCDVDENYTTGERTRQSYHLDGYTEAEQREIFRRVMGRKGGAR